MGFLTQKVMPHVDSANRVFLPFALGMGPKAIWGQKWLFLAQNYPGSAWYLPTLCMQPRAPSVTFWIKSGIRQGRHLAPRMARVEQSSKRWNGVMAKPALASSRARPLDSYRCTSWRRDVNRWAKMGQKWAQSGLHSPVCEPERIIFGKKKFLMHF